jgi:mono/diheme cytochrome c family protein
MQIFRRVQGPDKIAFMFDIRAWVICSLLCALPAFAAEKGNAMKGKQEFRKQCAVCHSENDQKKMGPGLKALFKKAKLVNGRKPTEASVRAKIDDGGNGMPAYKDMMSDQEKDDMIAYLKTL